MNPRTEAITQRLLRLLQDETRLAIYIHLLVYNKLTLKQLSEYLGKGRTTIHHHIKKFEEEGILTWIERKEDRKKLKTRYYSISDVLGEEWENKGSLVGMIRIEALISNYLTELLINYIEEHPEANRAIFEKFGEPFIIKIPLTEDILPIYEEFLMKLSKIYKKKKIDEFTKEKLTPITHFGSQYYSFWFPIKEILDWRQKPKRE
ncbi:MAG: winged helix-turn-helix domain-containing protein [Candidatus Hodarchaeota archaeon]